MSCMRDSDVAPWALGALDDDDATSFAVHLRHCEACQRSVASLGPVADALAVAVPQMAPSPELKSRIMAEVEGSPRAVAAPAPARARRSWFAGLSRVPAAGLAAVLLALGVGGGALLLGGDDETARPTIAKTIGVTSPVGAKAKLIVEDGVGTLALAGMPQAPKGRVYQVWIKRGDQDPRPTHTLFTIRSDGKARVRIDEPIRTGEQVLVTDEPAGGSFVPSGELALASQA